MRTYLESEDIANLAAAATNQRDCLLINMLFQEGCRISELLAAAVDDIDFQNSTIRIQHLKVRLSLSCPECRARLSRNSIFCPKCGVKVKEAVAKEVEKRRQRILPINRRVLDMLKNYIQRGGPVVKNGKGLIFGINRHRAWQIIKSCAERAGLPKLVNQETGKVHNVSPHRLRDAFSVHAVKVNDSGDGLRMLQQHLGHQSITTTMRYRKVAGEELKQWYEKLWKDKDDH